MNTKQTPICLFLSFFIIVCLLITGCFDSFVFDNNLRYEEQPTKVQYTITYGYTVECKGSGDYELNYQCDLPTVLKGTITATLPLYAQDYRERIIINNTIYEWNISDDTAATYTLGVSSTVYSETTYVSDLNGVQALTTTEIRQMYPQIVNQYCQNQEANDEAYINPEDETIIDQAHEIRRLEDTDNSLLLAKALFVWLKDNTRYYVHPSNPEVQPALVTLDDKKGDCDDLSFLYISLCRALNIPARFIRGYLITTAENMPSIGPHAWAEVFVGGNLGKDGWIPVECACTAECNANIHQNFGTEDVSHLRLFVDDGSVESLEHSLSSVSWSYIPGIEITAEAFVNVDDYVILEEKQLVVSPDGMRSYQKV